MGHSASRALVASGSAAAFARQAVFVSVFEVANNLPNIGYYFGLEPQDYLASALCRKRVVSGMWNGVVRFACSASLASLVREIESVEEFPHVLILAFSLSRDDIATQIQSISRISRNLSSKAGLAASEPDALILIGANGQENGIRVPLEAARLRFPKAMSILCAHSHMRVEGIDECVVISCRDAARRSPPEDPGFNELASIVLQRISSKRRRKFEAANG